MHEDEGLPGAGRRVQHRARRRNEGTRFHLLVHGHADDDRGDTADAVDDSHLRVICESRTWPSNLNLNYHVLSRHLSDSLVAEWLLLFCRGWLPHELQELGLAGQVGDWGQG